MDTEHVSGLQRDIAARIVSVVRRRALAAGAPLRESVLAREFSVSRTPVRAALDYLCRTGAVEHVPRRGYFLAADAAELPQFRIETTADAVKRAYNAMIDAYFRGELSERVSEAELARRFRIERSAMQETMSRLKAEGVARPNPGYGWQFTPLRKSREADEADYFRFRLLLEPALFLEPTFRADPDRLAAARREQVEVIEALDAEFDIARVYEANERVHRMLAGFSGNRFIISALDHYEPTDRLIEYRRYQDRPRIRTACEEHVAILDAVGRGDLAGASTLMRRHIETAKRTGA